MIDAIFKLFLFLVICVVGICATMAYVSQDTSNYVTDNPTQSELFDGITCNDWIELPPTETIWGDMSNGYKCGHE